MVKNWMSLIFSHLAAITVYFKFTLIPCGLQIPPDSSVYSKFNSVNQGTAATVSRANAQL